MTPVEALAQAFEGTDACSFSHSASIREVFYELGIPWENKPEPPEWRDEVTALLKQRDAEADEQAKALDLEVAILVDANLHALGYEIVARGEIGVDGLRPGDPGPLQTTK